MKKRLGIMFIKWGLKLLKGKYIHPEGTNVYDFSPLNYEETIT